MSTAPLTLVEWYAWFHVYGFYRALRTRSKRRTSKWIQNLPLHSTQSGFFSNKWYDSYDFFLSLSFCTEYAYVQLNEMVAVYRQKDGIHMDNNCAPLTDLIQSNYNQPSKCSRLPIGRNEGLIGLSVKISRCRYLQKIIVNWLVTLLSLLRQQSLSFIDYIYFNKSKSYAWDMQAKLKERKIILENFAAPMKER